MEQLNKLFKERWRYYLAGYIFMYIVSLALTGVPDISYLVPIKLYPLGVGILFGTLWYYMAKGFGAFDIPVKLIKYIVAMSVILIIINSIGECFPNSWINSDAFWGLK